MNVKMTNVEQLDKALKLLCWMYSWREEEIHYEIYSEIRSLLKEFMYRGTPAQKKRLQECLDYYDIGDIV